MVRTCNRQLFACKFERLVQSVLLDIRRYRSLPLSGLLAAGAHLGVQRGLLRPSPSYGARPKVVLGVLVGYFAGKFSYADACADKFLVQVNRGEYFTQT